MKGYIVATRFATEADRRPRNSSIYAEDPVSLGEIPLGDREQADLGKRILSAHYSNIAEKLGQPILAAALSRGFVVPDEILFPVIIWKMIIPPLDGKRFVGGYFPSSAGVPMMRQSNGRFFVERPDRLRLDLGTGTFFGVEETIFRQVVIIARAGLNAAAQVQRFEAIEPFYSGISVLRDGSVIGPLEFFIPVEQAIL